jgi:hypothetical protein
MPQPILHTGMNKQLVLVLMAMLLTGCSKQKEISGEIFTRITRNYKDEIIRQSGTAIYFLTSKEHETFERLLKEWHEKEYEDDRALWATNYQQYTNLFNKYKKDDGKVYDPDIISQLNVIEAKMDVAKANIEQRLHDEDLSLRRYEPIEQFLTQVQRTVADSEGKFKLVLVMSHKYWIVAESESPPLRQWDFRYVPDGTKLVLSNGNEM